MSQDGLSTLELMQLKPEKIKAKQKREIKRIIVATLRHAIACIEAEIYEEIPIEHSPAGDGMGCDNDYLKFHVDGTRIEDIGSAIDVLKEFDIKK